MTTPSDDARTSDRKGPILRALQAVARAGDRLPDPAVLFVALAALVVAASFVGARRHVSLTNPVTGASLSAENLLSAEGVRRLAEGAVKSFVTYPQLGVAIAALLGVFVAERSGVLGAAFRRLAALVPPWALTALLFFAAAHVAIAGDTGIYVLVPLGAILFRSAGRSPLAGLSAAFSGATGGYGAGFLLTSMDAKLAAITGSSATPTSTYYFTCAATVLLTATGTLVHHALVEPLFSAGDSDAESEPASVPVAADEGRALRLAGVGLLALLVVLAALVVPEKGLLRDDSGSPKPFFAALPLVAMVACLVPAAVFGYFAGSIPDHRAFVRVAGRAAADIGPYLVLAFVAAQLLAAVDASNLAAAIVVKASHGVPRSHLHGAPLAIGVAGLAAVLGLLVPSASARWGLMAASVVPAVVAAGGTPESALAAFRTGLGPALMVTPLLPHYAVFAACAKRWSPRAGAGTLVAATLPQSIAFGAAWLVLLAVWLSAGLPLGPATAP
ncbi:MAG: AbgT family transporter [Polyangiaceae bacterium]